MFSTFSDLQFSGVDVAKFVSLAFTTGVFFMTVRQLQKDQVKDTEKHEQALAEHRSATTSLVTELKMTLDRRLDHMSARQELLEVRHIQAVEKLGEAMTELATEVRGRLGDHGSRINYLERTADHP